MIFLGCFVYRRIPNIYLTLYSVPQPGQGKIARGTDIFPSPCSRAETALRPRCDGGGQAPAPHSTPGAITDLGPAKFTWQHTTLPCHGPRRPAAVLSVTNGAVAGNLGDIRFADGQAAIGAIRGKCQGNGVHEPLDHARGGSSSASGAATGRTWRRLHAPGLSKASGDLLGWQQPARGHGQAAARLPAA